MDREPSPSNKRWTSIRLRRVEAAAHVERQKPYEPARSIERSPVSRRSGNCRHVCRDCTRAVGGSVGSAGSAVGVWWRCGSAITGLAFPELGLRGAEMTVHFIAGLFGGARALAYEDIDESDFPEGSREHRWLKAAFTFGVVFAVVLALLLRL